MLSAFVALAAALAVSAQTPPFSHQTLLKPSLNGDHCLTIEGTTHGSVVDIQPCSEGAMNKDWATVR